MRFLHLSDLHIGLKLHNHDLGEDQAYVFRQIADAASREKPDAVVIAGDIYDKAVPSAEAVELFDRFLTMLAQAVPEAEIMLISGNHDSAPRINVFRGILKDRKIRMIGMPPQEPSEYIEKVTLADAFGDVHFYLLPFVKPTTVKNIVGADENGNNLTYDESVRRLIARENIDGTARNVLVSHQFYYPAGTEADKVERMESEIRTVGNIDGIRADVLKPFDYAALGHIHKPMTAGSEYFRYSGTPIACSVSEAGQQKGIILVEMAEKGDIRTSVIPLKPLREVKEVRGTLEEVLVKSCDDYVRVVLTDKVDLDVIDMQDRIRQAFPNLLEIRRDTGSYAEEREEYSAEKELDPYELCCEFLGETGEDEQQLLREVINAAGGGKP